MRENVGEEWKEKKHERMNEWKKWANKRATKEGDIKSFSMVMWWCSDGK